MSDLNSTVNTLITRETELTSDNGKVSRFSYTQKAYTDNDYAGVDTYAYGNEQNIPKADATAMNTNSTVINKGFRTQASSITRQLMNHFLGRLSYNVNKIHDNFLTFLTAFQQHMKRDESIYSETAIYDANDLCFVLDSDNNKRSFRCKLNETQGQYPLNEDGTINSTYWDEISVSSVNGYVGKVVVTGADINVSTTDTDTIAEVVERAGSANGFATLDENGRLPYSQLPESAIEYKGTWDASTNTPELKDGAGTNGDFYICTVGGTVTFSEGNTETFLANDRVICTGTGTSAVWTKLQGGAINSVNGQKADGTGNVKLTGEHIETSDSDTTLVSASIAARQKKPIYITQAAYDALSSEERAGNFYIIEDASGTDSTCINDNLISDTTCYSSKKAIALAHQTQSNTEEGVTAYTVDLPGFALADGATVRVLFKTACTVDSVPTVNVNGTGAKPLYRVVDGVPREIGDLFGDSAYKWKAYTWMNLTYIEPLDIYLVETDLPLLTEVNKLKANQFGIGTCDTDTSSWASGDDAPVLAVSLTNFTNITVLEAGAKFRVVFTNDYAADTQPEMSVNGGTSYPVTVGNVASGIGAFQADKSYEFCFTGTSYDCLSIAYSERTRFPDYANPITMSSDTWTATCDCYITYNNNNKDGSTDVNLYINGNKVNYTLYSSDVYYRAFFGYAKKGDVIKTRNLKSTNVCIYPLIN